MALTVANVGRGNYVLGGLGRVEGPSAAEAMDLAQREEQRFRDAQRAARETELGMQETRQRMALAQSAEQRAQQTFEAQQAARAQAAARAAQARATEQQRLEMFRDIFGGPATPTGGVSGVAPIAPVAPPRAGLALPTGPSVPLSFGTAVPGAAPAAPAPATPAPAAPAAGTPLSMGPVTPAGGVQVASLDPREAFRLAFESRPDLFGGGVQVADASGAIPAGALPTGQPVRAEFGGIPFDVYPDGRVVNTLTNTELPATGEYDALRTMLVQQVGVGAAPQAAVAAPTFREVDPNAPAFTQDVQGLLRQGDIAGALSRIQVGLATGQYGPMGSPLGRAVGYFADTPEEAARRTAVRTATQWFNDPENEQMLRDNPQLLAEAAADPIGFAARRQTPAEAPSPEAAEAETLEVPISPGAAGAAGLSFPFTPSVELSFSIGEETPSERYLNNADLVMMDRDRVAQQIARTQQLLQYYATTGDRTGLDQGLAMVQAQDELAKLEINQRYLDGMVALSAIQNGNFGPLQYLLQQRPENQGRTVEVRPYTDETVEIYVDGQLDADLSWADLVSNLQYVYDRGYQELREALAQEAAERRRYRFEQLTQAERDIFIAQAQAELEASGAGGTLESVTDADGTPILQYTVNGRRIPVSAERYVVQEPGVGDVVRIRLRRIDTGEIVPINVE